MGAEFHGSFILVLHSHLPYVLRHGAFEEEMLLEAAAECYIPLLRTFERLATEGVSPKVTVGLSPCLVDQLADPYFQRRFREYCLEKAAWAVRDRGEFEHDNAHLAWLARRWEQFYLDTCRTFTETYRDNLPGAFRALQDAGHIELITCAATHAYLPVLYSDATVRAQLRAAVAAHTRHFGRAPRGLWLPECGFRPAYPWRPPFTHLAAEPPRDRTGLDDLIAEQGLRFFVIDGHQLEKSWPPDLAKTPFSTYATVHSNGFPPPTVFARDVGLSLQVWRHQVGYPGDGVYLEFHKRHGQGRHRYWKVTDNRLGLDGKDLYYPDDAERFRIPEHAGHYKFLIAQALRRYFLDTGRPGAAVVAFDTELFGHWWFEGPQFLYHVIKWMHQDPELAAVTCSEHLERFPAVNRIGVAESSWGNHFDHSTWVNPEVEWVWERIYHAERELGYLAREFKNGRLDPPLSRILNQAAREAFLLMASDWQFMITNWSTRDHAEHRAHEHHADFERLARMAWDYGAGRAVAQDDWTFLADAEQRDRLLEDLDISFFAEDHVEGGTR